MLSFCSDGVANIPGQLYTKAYELFKKHSFGQGQSRLTFYIACRIAQTYHDSGKFDMAVRFFERIAKTYRKEHWRVMLKPILFMWYACARQIGDVESIVKLLIEMMGCGMCGDTICFAELEGFFDQVYRTILRMVSLRRI
jgi:trafficking protein particle complex subunit 11